MLDPTLRERLRSSLVATAGGHLRNPVREPRVTCAVCTTPVDGFTLCRPCDVHRRGHRGLADAVAPLTYAVAGRQSGYVMRGYKARPRIEEHYEIVAMLVLLGLSMHGTCPEGLGGATITHWATVPSLPAKRGEHPFHQLVRSVAPWPEAGLTAAAVVANPRELNGAHFSAATRLPTGSHVLLMDDTWTQGGHAQSAVLSLKAAGARRVSVLVASRWVKEGYGDNARFLRTLAGRDYDPATCPWTGQHCP